MKLCVWYVLREVVSLRVQSDVPVLVPFFSGQLGIELCGVPSVQSYTPHCNLLQARLRRTVVHYSLLHYIYYNLLTYTVYHYHYYYHHYHYDYCYYYYYYYTIVLLILSYCYYDVLHWAPVPASSSASLLVGPCTRYLSFRY